MIFTTLDQMLDECRARNAAQWVKDAGRWYFVVPARGAEPAHIDYAEGSRAKEMRARVEGTGDLTWKPEPGEMEWIKTAAADYLRQFPPRADETEQQIRQHFSATMARWSADKPWRQTGAAA